MLKLFVYLKPYWKSVILAPLLMLLEVAMDLMQPTLMARIVDEGVRRGDVGLIFHTGGLMVLVALAGVIGGMGCTVFSSIASQGFGTDLREALFERVQRFSFRNLDKFKTASLITRLTNDVMQVQNVVLMLLRILVRAPLLCVGGIIMAFSINSKLAMILAVTIPVLVVALSFVIRKGFPLFAVVQKRLDEVNRVMQENLSGVRVVKAFVRSGYEIGRFGTANRNLMDISVKAGRILGMNGSIMILVMNLSIIGVLWFGGSMVNTGSLHVGQVIAFTNYFTQILFSLMMVTFLLMAVSRAKASADRIGDVLNTEPDIRDKPGAVVVPIERGLVEFRNVSFRYDGAGGAPILRNVSFTAQPGETVALLGATGSGKSTLVHLIPRFYDVTEGQVLVDGADVRDIALDTLRKSIGMVLQESVLFSGTIKDNIRWGREDATDREVEEAAKAAQAHEFISRMPDGYDTVLGQRGVNLSGGQKQRLAIARALLRKPAVLILDDSTSAVDMGTESRLQEALRQLMKHSTCFVIAQRISSVLEADKIIVLEDGQVADIGTHSQLIGRCPVYQDIYQSQLGEGEAVNG